MKTLKLAVALLISIALGTVATKALHMQSQNQTLARQLNQKTTELANIQAELTQTQTKLATAENQIGFLEKNKVAVQMTAYTAPPTFLNGTAQAHKVDSHANLPDDKVIYVALSPPLQEKLHAHRNDYIVLIRKNSRHKTLARFMDATSPAEHRPVVDLLFSNPEQAKVWGRRMDYSVVDISSSNSPFRRVLDRHEKQTKTTQHRRQSG